MTDPRKEHGGEFLYERIRSQFPLSQPELIGFPSGAFTIELTINNEKYAIEYFAQFAKYGFSRICTATYGFEGVEEELEDADAVERHLKTLLK